MLDPARPFVAYARSIALGRQAFHDPRSKQVLWRLETAARSSIGRPPNRLTTILLPPENGRNAADAANQTHSGELRDTAFEIVSI
jgi:hypothetical protein